MAPEFDVTHGLAAAFAARHRGGSRDSTNTVAPGRESQRGAFSEVQPPPIRHSPWAPRYSRAGRFRWDRDARCKRVHYSMKFSQAVFLVLEVGVEPTCPVKGAGF